MLSRYFFINTLLTISRTFGKSLHSGYLFLLRFIVYIDLEFNWFNKRFNKDI